MKVFSVLKPVLYLGFALGLVPYSLHNQSLFIPTSLYSLAIIFLVWQSCTKIVSMVLLETVTDLYAYGFLLPLQMSFNSLMTFIALVTVLYRHQMWIEMFQELKHIEISLEIYEAKATYVSSLVIQITGLIFLATYECLYYFSFYYNMLHISWIVVGGQSLTTAVNIVLLIEFLSYITILKRNFSVINGKLSSLLDYSFQAFETNNLFLTSHTMKGEKLSYLVKLSREIHRHLCGICRNVNKSFSLQLLISISKAIVLITVILYTISLTFLGKTDPNLNLLIYLSVISSVLIQNAIELLVLIFICSSVCDQANYTAVLVHKLMNRDLPPSTREELQLFSYQLLHQKVYFSVCGFFNLDFTLLNGVIPSVATYLVILIQFQM